MLDVIIPSLLSGVASATLVAFVNHYFVWKEQKRLEAKRVAFDAILSAIAMYAADALDIDLQSKKPSSNSATPVTHFRTETKTAIIKAQALAEAMYSEKTCNAVKAVFTSRMSIDNVPNAEFENSVEVAVKLLTKELDR